MPQFPAETERQEIARAMGVMRTGRRFWKMDEFMETGGYSFDTLRRKSKVEWIAGMAGEPLGEFGEMGLPPDGKASLRPGTKKGGHFGPPSLKLIGSPGGAGSCLKSLSPQRQPLRLSSGI